jgi:hypothetical protein
VSIVGSHPTSVRRGRSHPACRCRRGRGRIADRAGKARLDRGHKLDHVVTPPPWPSRATFCALGATPYKALRCAPSALSARLAQDIVTVNRDGDHLARGLDDVAPSASDRQVRDGHAAGRSVDPLDATLRPVDMHVVQTLLQQQRSSRQSCAQYSPRAHAQDGRHVGQVGASDAVPEGVPVCIRKVRKGEIAREQIVEFVLALDLT